MFLIRSAFWLSVVVLCLPGAPGDETAPGASLVDTVVAVRGAIADVSGMCARQPDVCTSGGAALKSFGAKARFGAAMLSEAVAAQHDDMAPTPVATMPAEAVVPAAVDSGTLTPRDTGRSPLPPLPRRRA